jgi:peptidoglycan/xylan/chitin deacetylase (PgdA/CDA1 family)
VHGTHPLPILLCFDVEPDGFFIDPARRDPWAGFEATYAFVEALRIRWQALCERPIRLNWFLRLDAQIARVYGDAAWVMQRYAREMTQLMAHGDELGLHPHPYRWDAGGGQWILDYARQPWVTECIESATRTFAAATGRAPRSFRCGDRFMNQATADVVSRLGYDYDLTLEPGHRDEALPYPPDRATGRLPDLRGVPPVPYRARTGDYRRPDPAATRGPWTVPITTAAVRPSLVRRVYQRVRYPGRRFDVWTALLSLNPAVFDRIVNAALERPTPYLALVLRTGAMVDGRSPLRIAANVDLLSRLMRARPCAVVGPGEAVSLLSGGPAPQASRTSPAASRAAGDASA